MKPFLLTLIVAAVLGFGLGKLSSVALEAQPSLIMRASDDTSHLGVTIQTDGSNALKVIGK